MLNNQSHDPTDLYRNLIGQAIFGLPVTVLQLDLLLPLPLLLLRLLPDA